MIKTLKVLGSMLTLKEFTVETLQKHSGINPATIRTVLSRKEQILEKLGFLDTGQPGGKLIRYRLKPEAVQPLRNEIGDIFDQVKELPEARPKERPEFQAPLGLLAAENALLRLFPKAKDAQEKRELLETAERDVASGRLELRALAKAPEKAKVGEALMHSVNVLKDLAKAELAAELGTTELGGFPAIFGEFLRALSALSSSGQTVRISALTERVWKSFSTNEVRRRTSRRGWDLSGPRAEIKALAAGAGHPNFMTSPERNRYAIAVIPLVGNKSSQTYMYDGITRGIWSRVCELPDLTVVAPTRVSTRAMELKNAQEVQDLGRELNVQAVLLGSVALKGDHLQCNAQLVSVENGAPLWQHNYDTQFADVFSMEEDISKSVSDNLQIYLTNEERAQLGERPTENSEAYRLYMEGRYRWRQWTADGIEKSIEYFKQALKKDPRYALAYAGLADSYNMCTYELGISPGECFPKAKAAAYEALEIDDRLAEAYTALAYARLRYYWDWEEAEAKYLQAISLNSNYTLARLWYAEYLAAMSRFDEAIEQLTEAQRLDPESLIIRVTTGSIYYFAGEYDRAIDQFVETLKKDENFVRAHFRIGGVYVQKGMYPEAIKELSTAVKLSHSNPREESSLAYAYAVSGDHANARNTLDRLERTSKHHYLSLYNVALIYTGLGEKDAAFESLQKAYEDRDPWLVFLKVDPRLTALRSDPRFTALAEHVGFSPQLENTFSWSGSEKLSGDTSVTALDAPKGLVLT